MALGFLKQQQKEALSRNGQSNEFEICHTTSILGPQGAWLLLQIDALKSTDAT